MNSNFVTLAQLSYAHAHYLKKELQIENIHAILDFCVSDDGVSDMNRVNLQVQEDKVQNAISKLFIIADQLGRNPLTEISLSNYEDTPLILVPVDLKDHSYALGKHAITLAKRIGAEIKFLNIYYEAQGVSNIAAYEDFQHTVHVQEEYKAKEKMLSFSEQIREYANSMNFPSSSIHFGLSRGNVIEQIGIVADKCAANLILLGPEDVSAADYEPGVVRKTVRKANVPVLVLPLKETDPESSINNVVYFAEDLVKMVTYQQAIERIFSKSVSSTLLYSNNIKEEELPEFNPDLNLEILSVDTLDRNIVEYLKETGTTLLVFDTPKTGLIAQLFGNTFFRDLMKQEEFPVLFLK
ncbi:MAG: universal stress protein [Bacteroidetes bacterium]|nr:universal stress protein [Bacteroidota bacterium]